MKRFAAFATLIGTVIAGSVALAQGTTRTVMPLGLNNGNGNQNEIVFDVPTERQYWFSSDYARQAWTSAVLVSAVSFRVNEQPAPFSVDYNATIPRVEISLTTTSRSRAELSPQLQENVGSDVRTVFASDNVLLSSPGGSGPNPFGLTFTFSEPFRYDPAAGHLLMWIRTSGAGEFQPRGTHVDAHSFSNAEAIHIAAIGGTYSSAVGPGIVTEFTWRAIPEPRVCGLLTLSLCLLSLIPTRTRWW